MATRIDPLDESQQRHIKIQGRLIAELLDQQEYPSNMNEVAAVSDEQIMVVRRDRNELVGFRLDQVDLAKCRSIEYERDTAWYRVVIGAACFVGVGVLLIMLLMDLDDFVAKATPFIIGSIALASFGVRFLTSTHRHILRFEMPDETLTWKSPPIDYDLKSEEAHAVRAFARGRGLLKGSGSD